MSQKELVATQPSALQQPFHKKTSRLFKKDRHLKVVCNAFSSQAGAFFFFLTRLLTPVMGHRDNLKTNSKAIYYSLVVNTPYSFIAHNDI